ncbi:hypothetical protein [Streptomyces sp. UNOC14_S4]|uniref:hypothetical protein n=1 Tax=Streptomyces sp. UNOC14_S4 TaxID=2872340 RepID=UPI001E376F38|nr:hypothetical protein [Streptomyces sp. UNOC14_S4]MCC3769573.1 hypothetical protein [Streptomyces sp. UNOC14_S4]
MARYRRRLCLAVDLRHYSRHHTYPEQGDAQYRLRLVVEYALRRARVPRVRTQQQLQGDGQLIVFPVRTDAVRTVPALVLGLRDGLYQANRAPGAFGRLRMRAALGQGAVSRADRGYLGDCVVLVNRLVDADQVRDALEADDGSDLALAVPDDVYRDVILPQARGLSAAEFHRIDVVVRKKDFASSAWLHVPKSAPARDLGANPVIWGHSPGRTAMREFVVPALGAAHVAATVVSHGGALCEWVLTGGHGEGMRATAGVSDGDFDGPDDTAVTGLHHADARHGDGPHEDDHHSGPHHPDARHPDLLHPRHDSHHLHHFHHFHHGGN